MKYKDGYIENSGRRIETIIAVKSKTNMSFAGKLINMLYLSISTSISITVLNKGK